MDCSRCAARTVVRGPIRVLGTQDSPEGWSCQGPIILRRSLLGTSLLLAHLGVLPADSVCTAKSTCYMPNRKKAQQIVVTCWENPAKSNVVPFGPTRTRPTIIRPGRTNGTRAHDLPDLGAATVGYGTFGATLVPLGPLGTRANNKAVSLRVSCRGAPS